MATTVETINAMWVKCGHCRHVWPAAYLPMEMAKCARLLRKLHCPRCGEGSKQIYMAEAKDLPREARA